MVQELPENAGQERRTVPRVEAGVSEGQKIKP